MPHRLLRSAAVVLVPSLCKALLVNSLKDFISEQNLEPHRCIRNLLEETMVTEESYR